jgi:hypothetical protein
MGRDPRHSRCCPRGMSVSVHGTPSECSGVIKGPGMAREPGVCVPQCAHAVGMPEELADAIRHIVYHRCEGLLDSSVSPQP